MMNQLFYGILKLRKKLQYYCFTSIAFNNSGTILASGSFDFTVQLWNIDIKTEIATLKGN